METLKYVWDYRKYFHAASVVMHEFLQSIKTGLETQNHCNWTAPLVFDSSSLQQLQQLAQDTVHFELCFQGLRLHYLLGQPLSVSEQPYRKKPRPFGCTLIRKLRILALFFFLYHRKRKRTEHTVKAQTWNILVPAAREIMDQVKALRFLLPISCKYLSKYTQYNFQYLSFNILTKFLKRI